MFRPESLDAQREAWLGPIHLIRPLSLTVLTVAAVVAAVAVGTYLSLGEYTRKARVSGWLAPDRGLIRLTPTEAGTVIERHASEGQAVKAGEALFVLSVDRSTAAGGAEDGVQRSLATRERSLHDAIAQQVALTQEQVAALDRRLADMRRELAQIGTERDLQRQRLALARQSLARLESLQRDNFISPAQVQNKSEELLGLQAQIQALERQQATQQREIGIVEARRRELPLQSQVRQGELERELAELSQQGSESAARQRLVIRAPMDGVLSAVTAQPGQSVVAGSALATLLPANASLQAHLYAPSSALGFVRADQKVQLRYPAYPYQKFGLQQGRVLEVARTPLAPAEVATLGNAARGDTPGEPLYRITVALDQQSVQAYGQAQALSPGMAVDADVLLDRRRLVEWLFEPVLGLAGRV
jgi:membrane fusion protein